MTPVGRRGEPASGAAEASLGTEGPECLPALADLWVAAWSATLPDVDFEARRDWFLRNCETRMAAGARLLVLRGQAGVAGFVLIDPDTGYLDQIAVAPERRGGDAAARLLDAAKTLAPAGIALDVNTENSRAVRFYRKHGFTVTGRSVNPNSGRPVFAMRWRP